MEEKRNIRLLKAEEIDVRVGAIYEKGITLLLYKDARVDMAILDEIYGPMNWSRRHVMFGDVMFCELAVKNTETGEWVVKMDVGSPSFAEPIKGQASDSFKRTGVLFGIGRELYTAPFIWLDRSKVDIDTVKSKEVVKDHFTVQTIQYDEEKRCITGLIITNQKKQVVYQYMASASSKKNEEQVIISPEQISELYTQLKRTGVPLEQVLNRYKIKAISEMTPEVWLKAMNSLRMTASKVA